MFSTHNGIICGGVVDGQDYRPKLENCGGTQRLVFKILFTRGGNSSRNYDVFEMKCLGKIAEKYWEELKGDACKGKTVNVQFSLENNSNGFIYEMICSFIRFEIGEEIYFPNKPSFACQKDAENVSTQEKLNNSDDVVCSSEHTTNNHTKQTNSMALSEEEKSVIDESLLHAPPVGVVNLIKLILSPQKDETIGLVSTNDANSTNKVVSVLSQNEDYMNFRNLMG